MSIIWKFISLIPSILIRDANEDDYPAIAKISVVVWQHAYRGMIDENFLNNISWEQRLEGRLKWVSDQNKYSIVAVCNGKIIGFCDFGVAIHPQYSKGEIYTLYILPDYQGRGVGTMLMERAMLCLEKEGLTPYIVIVLEKNIPAQTFYEKLGFSFIDDILSDIGGAQYQEKVYLCNRNMSATSKDD